LRFSQASDTGLVRSRNEDSFVLMPTSVGAFLAVADGIGGLPSGEVASRLAVRTLSRAFRKEGAFPPDAASLRSAFARANEAILRARAADPGLEMGTTLTCAWVEGSRCVFAHVGNSRLYLMSGEELRQLTDDHSVVGELMKKGTIDREGARRHPERHVLTKALGVEARAEVDVREIALGAGDVLILCTDGLTAALTEEAIVRIVGEGFEDAAARLVEAANRAGGSDNVTILLAMVEGVDVETGIGA